MWDNAGPGERNTHKHVHGYAEMVVLIFSFSTGPTGFLSLSQRNGKRAAVKSALIVHSIVAAQHLQLVGLLVRC